MYFKPSHIQTDWIKCQDKFVCVSSIYDVRSWGPHYRAILPSNVMKPYLIIFRVENTKLVFVEHVNEEGNMVAKLNIWLNVALRLLCLVNWNGLHNLSCSSRSCSRCHMTSLSSCHPMNARQLMGVEMKSVSHTKSNIWFCYRWAGSISQIANWKSKYEAPHQSHIWQLPFQVTRYIFRDCQFLNQSYRQLVLTMFWTFWVG